MRSLLLIIASAILAIASAPATAAENTERWAAYYRSELPPRAFRDYDLLIFDADDHPLLRPIADRGAEIYGYLSLGEVNRQRRYFDAVESDGILLGENPNWPGSFFVDIRDRRWIQRVIDRLVPSLLRKGFSGIFIDTLDNPAYLERTDPVAYAGMTEAAARLVRTIARHYPEVPIMLNRAFEILPSVANDIDRVLGESIYSDFDSATSTYTRVAPAIYRRRVAALVAAKAANPDLVVHTLDYWDPADDNGIRAIYAAERANGFVPYVATVALDRLIPEPPQ